MKLKRLWVDGFKNINDFEINFSENLGTTVLIGNNGCGKSNILESISAIFTSLFKLSNSQRKPTFQYEIEYELEGDNYKLSLKKARSDNLVYSFKKNSTSILKRDFETDCAEYLPSNVIAIYSGEESRLWDDYYQSSYSDFMAEVKKDFQSLPSPKLIYLNKYHWNIALLTLLYSSLENNVEFCKRILKVESVDEINIRMKFNKNNLKNFSQNSIVSFVNSLNNNDDEEKNISINVLRENQLIASEKELFLKLMASVMDKQSKYKLIDQVEISYNNVLTTAALSEGEKKQILIRVALEVLADTNSLSLFDEPDSHIHVANKGQIKVMLDEYESRETILTTHSPTLMHVFEKNLVYLEDGAVKGKEKAEILKDISGDLMTITEQQIALNSSSDILLVEGKFDIQFIKEAIERLEGYEDLRNIVFIPTGGASGLRLFIDKFTANDGQSIIAILDNDDAGNNEIKEILTDEYRPSLNADGYVKINELKNTFLLMLPKPTTVQDVQYEIEDYFPVEKLIEIAKDQIDTFKILKNFVLKKDTVKRKLSDKCKNNELNDDDFDEFKILLDLIREIKQLEQ